MLTYQFEYLNEFGECDNKLYIYKYTVLRVLKYAEDLLKINLCYCTGKRGRWETHNEVFLLTGRDIPSEASKIFFWVVPLKGITKWCNIIKTYVVHNNKCYWNSLKWLSTYIWLQQWNWKNTVGFLLILLQARYMQRKETIT